MVKRHGAKTLLEIVREAVAQASADGPPSDAQLDVLMAKIRLAARDMMMTDAEVFADVKKYFGTIYNRLVVRGKIFDRMRGVDRFALPQKSPEIRAELDRCILASADLIRLNKTAQVEKTLRRYVGWLSSVPPGGTISVKRSEVVSEIIKPARQVKFEMRRVAIDQGHKFAANVSHIVATHGGAIGGIWHDRGQHDHNYDARKDHLKRSGKFFLVKNGWAITEGLIRKGSAPYIDSIERPAELPYCSCWYEYVASLHDVPRECLTKKGQKAIGLN